jgi:hypothetical protein
MMPPFFRLAALAGALLLSLALAGCGGAAGPTATPALAPTAAATVVMIPTPTPVPSPPSDIHVTAAPAATDTPLAAPAAPTPVPNRFQAGITVPVWSADGYRTAAADAAWPEIRALGATWVAIVPTWYQDGATASTIAPEAAGRSASRESVRHAIAAAHAAGLKVMLKPHVDSADDAWRGTFRPARPSVWFASYTAFITEWATLAEEMGVELFCVGTELVELSGPAFTAEWGRVVDAVRAVYHGPLTYAANWGKRPADAEYQQIAWWDRLDYIGIDAYFPLSGEIAPQATDLQAGWERYTDPWGDTYGWKAAITAVHERWNKPVLFTEVGYAATPYGGAAWDAPTPRPVASRTPTPPPLPVPAIQAAAYEALFAAWRDVPWFMGVYGWMWSLDPGSGGLNDATMLVNGKPPVLDALRVGFAELRR